MQKVNNEQQKVVALICDDCHCCPEIVVGKNEVFITDDFGGRIKLTKKQFSLFKEKVKKGKL